MKTDLTLAAIIAALPWISLNSAMEAKRMALLALVIVAASILQRFRLIDARIVYGAAGVTMLAIAWLESFPAWSHSAEIGTYIAAGAAVLALTSFRAARRSQLLEA